MPEMRERAVPVKASDVRMAVKAEFHWAWEYRKPGVDFEWPEDASVDYLASAFRESVASLQERERVHADEKRAAKRAYRNQWFRDREAEDPVFRLNRRISKQIWDAIGGRERRKWQTLVGYTLEDLRAHLEARFTEGMSWENAGSWHVDHVRPLSSFAITGPDCPEFKAAWALENLQPLWAADNLRKGARWDG
jgi:5-methylcytosine-specific restriction endonuclease McrA